MIADNTWAAMQGRQKLKVEWDPGEHASFASETYKQSLIETARQPQKMVRNVGDVDAAFASASQTHEAEYYVPHLAHAPMEPPAAVAEFKDGKVVVWAATQNPQAVQDTVASALGIGKQDVICHVTLLGGGFGRKSKPDYVAEAAILSKQVGKPVKVVWSREDDIRFDYYHSVAAMYMKAAMDAQGRPTAWLQRSVFPPIGSTFDCRSALRRGWRDGTGMGGPAVRHPEPARGERTGADHVRIGWLRSVANIYHAFAIQSFIDELAPLRAVIAVEYFLDVLGRPRQIDFKAEGTTNANYGKPLDQYPVDTGRLRRVVELAAERSGWAKKKPAKGRALGFAAHWSFLSYVAAVVDVEVDDKGRCGIPRVDLAVDAGRVMHPERVQAQFEGAAVFGASVALMGEITAANGQIQQSNFHDYPVARLTEAPYETHVHLLPSHDLPAGVGEPGVPPTIPALCNALFAATGKRIRQLPIKHTKLT